VPAQVQMGSDANSSRLHVRCGSSPISALLESTTIQNLLLCSTYDRFKNVEALEHEVFHAALWERGFRDTEKLQIHDWIYFPEGAFPLLFHDNPELVKYLTAGY